MKRILTIQDISCFGKCSTTIALPVISAMGVETVILPTAVLSTHTMFKNFTVKDLTDQLLPIAEHWQSEGVEFDAIYAGYLGSAEEIDIAKKIFRMFRKEGTLVFIDPVMGDNGRLYARFGEEYVKLNRELCADADVIVPNITEACFMTGNEYKETYDEAYIDGLLDGLAKLGAKKAVITGVSLSPGKTGVRGLDSADGRRFTYQNDRVPASFHGTGDLFASVAVGAFVQGISLEDAFRVAADYTALTIEATLKEDRDPRFGVTFEKTIPDLIRMLGH